jgi:hypothetical protein
MRSVPASDADGDDDGDQSVGGHGAVMFMPERSDRVCV